MGNQGMIFAKCFNKNTWEFLNNPSRSFEDDLRMISLAHASYIHWCEEGTNVHQQRGLWLLARVYTVIEYPKQALLYANQCEYLTQTFKGEMMDFDLAYAKEGLARANALAGNKTAAEEHLLEAETLGDWIQNAEDKEIFTGDLEGGNWFGIKRGKPKFCHG
jgi:hypothetical protein